MKPGPIVQEELLRSIPVYFVSFLAIGALNLKGHIAIGGISTFLLAFLITAVPFSLMEQAQKMKAHAYFHAKEKKREGE